MNDKGELSQVYGDQNRGRSECCTENRWNEEDGTSLADLEDQWEIGNSAANLKLEKSGNVLQASILNDSLQYDADMQALGVN